MFAARLICSDPGCDAEDEVEAATVAELESLACDCGCAMVIVGWPLEVEPEELAAVVSLRARGVLLDAA
jgi:hypothetical protein